MWRRRAAIVDEQPAVLAAEPFGLELAGEPGQASEVWSGFGGPYEAALQSALSELQRLGAQAAAAHAAAPCESKESMGCAVVPVPLPGSTPPAA